MSTDNGSPGDWTSPGQPPPPAYGAPPPQSPPQYGAPPPQSPPQYGAPPPQYPPQYGAAPPQWYPPAAPKPGVVALRPLAVGELLDGAFTTIRRYPAATLGMAALIMLFVTAVQVIVGYVLLHGFRPELSISANGTLTDNNGSYEARTLTLELVVFAVTTVATALLSGGISSVIGEGVLGRPMSASQAFAAARKSVRRLIGTILLIVVIEIAVIVVGVLPGVLVLAAGGGAGGGILIFLGGVSAVVLAIYLWVSFSFASPIVVLEKQTIRAALSRSRSLVKGSWWRIFGITLLAAVITFLIAAVIEVPFQLISGFGGVFSGHPENQFRFSALLLNGIGSLIAATLVRPFSAGITALLYIDRRMRSEGLDLSLQASAASPA